jgi:hypothetical protein
VAWALLSVGSRWRLSTRRSAVTTRKTVIVVGLGLYVLGMGVVAGVVIDRTRFDSQRAEVLGRYEKAVRDVQAHRMAFEKHAEGHR